VYEYRVLVQRRSTVLTALSREFDFIFTADPEPISDRLPAAAGGLLLQGRSAASRPVGMLQGLRPLGADALATAANVAPPQPCCCLAAEQHCGEGPGPKGQHTALCSPHGVAQHMAESPIAAAHGACTAVATDQSPQQQLLRAVNSHSVSSSAAKSATVQHLLTAAESPFRLDPGHVSMDIQVASSPPAPNDSSCSRLSASHLPIVHGADGSWEWGSPNSMNAHNRGASRWRRAGQRLRIEGRHEPARGR
jgi:hypothetical protein